MPCVVEIHGVELTQSVQKSPLSGAGTGDSVTLVAGRRTTARVYVTSTCAGDDVVAWLNLAHGSSYGGPVSIDAQGVLGPISPPTSSSELSAVRASDDNRAFAFWWRIKPRVPLDEPYDIKVHACSLSDAQCATMFNTAPRARVPVSIWTNGGPGVFSLPTQIFVYRRTPRILTFPAQQRNPLFGEPEEPELGVAKNRPIRVTRRPGMDSRART